VSAFEQTALKQHRRTLVLERDAELLAWHIRTTVQRGWKLTNWEEHIGDPSLITLHFERSEPVSFPQEVFVRVILPPSNGAIVLVMKLDLFSLEERERELVGDLVGRIQEYEFQKERVERPRAM